MSLSFFFFFFFNDTATTEIYTLSLHDALPISVCLPANRALRRTVDCYCGLNPRWEDGTIVVRARRSGLSCRSSGFGVLAAAGDAVVPELNLYCRAFPVAERDRRARGRDRLMRRAILAGVLLALIGVPLWAYWPRPRLADGVRADRIVVHKASRTLELYRGSQLLRSYPLAL